MCWGSNQHGQIGNWTSYDTDVPVDVAELDSGVGAIAAGKLHSCALTQLGGVMCWGWNYYGQLGIGNTSDTYVAGNVFGITSARALTTADHSCALLTDGSVRCWGFNNSGELGDGTQISRETPVAVVSLSNATQVTAGPIHTCALTMDSRVQCWGDNNYGELGNVAASWSSVPVVVEGFD